MEQGMRRAERAISRFEEMMEVVSRCRVCRIGMRDEEGPYILPLNFGYEVEDGQLVLYFHSAKEGRKLRALAADPLVAFEMDGAHRLLPAEDPCGWGYAYECLTGTGIAQLVEDPQEKCRALALLMRCQTGREFSFAPQQAAAVAVIRLRVQRMTGKARR